MKKKLLVCILIIAMLFVFGVLIWFNFFRPLVIPFWNTGKNATESDGTIDVSVEFPVYDKSCPYITLLIENNSDEPIEFGSDWTLEKKTLGSWMLVPFQPNVGFHSLLYILNPGGTHVKTCSLNLFNGSIEDGEYRIVKEIGDTLYYAPFEIGESEITAFSPFGYTPFGIEMISYDAEKADADGACPVSEGKIGNEEKFLDFLRAVQIPKRQAQIRLYEKINAKGNIFITDITKLPNGAYRVITLDQKRYSELKMKILASSQSNAGEIYGPQLEETISIRYYSYLVTDGKEIWLTNYSDLDHAEPLDTDFLLLGKDHVSDAIKTWIKKEWRAEEAEFTYSVWNPSGTRCVSTRPLSDDSLSYFTNCYNENGIRGTTYELNRDLIEKGYIREFFWKDDVTLLVTADMYRDFRYYEFRDTDTDERLSYTISQYDYVIKDGEIIIPE